MLVPNFASTKLFDLPLSVYSVKGSLLLRIQFIFAPTSIQFFLPLCVLFFIILFSIVCRGHYFG